MTALELTNYPASGTEAALRPVMFGGASDRVVVLIEIFEGDSGEDSYAFTIGNGPRNDEVSTFLTDLADMVTMVAESAGPVVAAKLERMTHGDAERDE